MLRQRRGAAASLIMGPCAGGAVYSPAMTDFIFMVKGTSYMFVTGPDVVKTVTNEVVTQEELGGAITHTTKTGVADLALENDIEALLAARRVLRFPAAIEPRRTARAADRRTRGTGSEDSLDTLIPANANQPYDMHELVRKVLDEGDFFELQPDHAANIIIGFGRVEGRTVGVVANQPTVLAGVLDINCSKKAARFVRFCDCVRDPDPDLRRRPRLPSRHRSRNWAGSSSTAPSCSSPMPRRPCPRSP